jgi:hypothetical protein
MGQFSIRKLVSYSRTDFLIAVVSISKFYTKSTSKYLRTFQGSIVSPSSDVSSRRRVH